MSLFAQLDIHFQLNAIMNLEVNQIWYDSCVYPYSVFPANSHRWSTLRRGGGGGGDASGLYFHLLLFTDTHKHKGASFHLINRLKGY